MRLDEIYKRRLLPPDCPRRGDWAAVKRDHCASESLTGLVVRVVNDPHMAQSFCKDCGQLVTEYFVEVEAARPPSPYWCADAAQKLDPTVGPYYHPITWLRRVLPLSSAGRRQ